METSIDAKYQVDYSQDMGATEDSNATSNGQSRTESENQHDQDYRSSKPRFPRGGGLKGSRSRIRFHPYKGIGTRTYKNSVFVSNIPYEMTEQDFKDLFEKEVGKVSFCEIFPEVGGLSTGCGVVEMEDLADVDNAIQKMKKFQIMGRGLVVRDDRDLNFSSRYRPQPVIKSNTSIVNPDLLHQLSIQHDEVSETIHIANLSEEVDLRKLKDVFSLAGLVMNLEITKDDEGKSLGLAKVTFSSCDEAVNAISMFDNQPLFDVKMSVRMDKGKKRTSSAEVKTELPQGLGAIGMNLLKQGAANPTMGRTMGGEMGGGSMGGAMGGYMGGSMGSYMGGDYGSYGGYDYSMSGMGGGMGYQTDSRGAYGGGGYGGGATGGYGGGPMRNYGVSSQAAPDQQLGTQVFIRNLSTEVTWEDLKDAFKAIGPVYYADIKRDQEGKSKCFGTVKYFSQQHAQQAILMMNGANLKGRRIGVTIGRY